MKSILQKILFALMVSTAGLTFAQPAPMPPGPQVEQRLKGLGLTDDQVTQVTDLYSKTQAANQTKRAQIKVLNAQIELGMTGSSPDLKALDVLVDQKVALQADIEKQFLAMGAQVHKIVGDTAYAQLQARFKMHRHAMMDHRGT